MDRHFRAVWRGQMSLGEGPAWDARTSLLWFVDIERRRVHRLDPATEEVRSWPAPVKVGWILPAEDGGLIAGLQTGLARFDPATGDFAPMCAVEPDVPGNRLNDAAVGPDGTIWFGSMDDGHQLVTGRIYRFDGRIVTPTPIAPVAITNGPALSPDGRTLYHVDTLGGIIHAVAVETDGTLGAQRIFATVDPADGNPDGVTVDSAGNVWAGIWGGWCARLYAPDGALMDEVRLPAANVTKIALGGSDRRTAYVTTARSGIDEDALTRQPEAGSLFAFPVAVPGQAFPPARLAR